MPKLKWTKSQKEVAELVKQGKTFADIIEAGYSKTMTSRVMNALKGEAKPSEKAPAATPSRQPKSSEPPETTVRKRTVDPVAVGTLLVLPEDWYISQHGAYLIQDTYKITQQQFNYGGTIGEFLVEVCQLYRDLLAFPLMPQVYEESLLEVLPDGRGEEDGEGGGVPEEDSGEFGEGFE